MKAKGGNDNAAILQQQEEARKATQRASINSLFDSDTAKSQFAKEEEDVKGALSGQYQTTLAQQLEDAMRNIKFKFGGSGNLTGSAYADAVARAERDNQTGGERITKAVEDALLGLRGGREEARNRALGLVNSGSGDQASAAASAAMKASYDQARNLSTQNIFQDLFGTLGTAKVLNDQREQQRKLANYFPTSISQGNTV